MVVFLLFLYFSKTATQLPENNGSVTMLPVPIKINHIYYLFFSMFTRVCRYSAYTSLIQEILNKKLKIYTGSVDRRHWHLVKKKKKKRKVKETKNKFQAYTNSHPTRRRSTVFPLCPGTFFFSYRVILRCFFFFFHHLHCVLV